MSSLHAQNLSLLSQPPGKHHCLPLNNIYIYFNLLYFCGVFLGHLLHHFAKQDGLNVPDRIKQVGYNKFDASFQVRGTLEVSVIWDVTNLTPIICSSLYDVNISNMMSRRPYGLRNQWIYFVHTLRKNVLTHFFTFTCIHCLFKCVLLFYNMCYLLINFHLFYSDS